MRRTRSPTIFWNSQATTIYWKLLYCFALADFSVCPGLTKHCIGILLPELPSCEMLFHIDTKHRKFKEAELGQQLANIFSDATEESVQKMINDISHPWVISNQINQIVLIGFSEVLPLKRLSSHLAPLWAFCCILPQSQGPLGGADIRLEGPKPTISL